MRLAYLPCATLFTALFCPVTAISASAQDKAPKPRVAVLDFHVTGKAETGGGALVAALVRREIQRAGKYDLMDREMMKERLTEKDWAKSAECDDVACMVEYGKSLDVQKIVGGQLGSFGKAWVITIRLVDVNTGREERTFTREHRGDMEDLLGIGVEGAREILGLCGTNPKSLVLNLGNGVKMDLVLIPAGEFDMGQRFEWVLGCDIKKPWRHLEHIEKPFYLAKCEVTQAQWRAVMGTTLQQQREKGIATIPARVELEGDDYPMFYVSWAECQQFCQKLSARVGRKVRLPTEVEWVYASRGATPDGPHDHDQYAWTSHNSGGRPHRVGLKRANAFGLHDMVGNVMEFCEQPWAPKYEKRPAIRMLGSSYEHWGGPGHSKASDMPERVHYRFNYMGFRVLVEIP